MAENNIGPTKLWSDKIKVPKPQPKKTKPMNRAPKGGRR